MTYSVGATHRATTLVAASMLLIMSPFLLAQQSPPQENVTKAPAVGDTAAADGSPSLLDSSHGYVTGRANALTRWIDNYFGGIEVDQEAASSRLRLRLIPEWDERAGNDFRVRLGGRVNLPAISRRLDLVFQGEDPLDQINGRDDPAQNRVGLQYQLGSRAPDRHRFDLTLGADSSGPRPGVKYRFLKGLSAADSLRFTQRIQYEFDDGIQSTTRLDLDHQLSEDRLLRSYSRVFYGEESDGLEWSTGISHVARWRDEGSAEGIRERASMVFAEVSGVTQPYDYVSNYSIGARYRRQTYREYLFVEIEPSYNWRIDEPGDPRRGAWKVQLRLELLLFDDLRRDSGALARR